MDSWFLPGNSFCGEADVAIKIAKIAHMARMKIWKIQRTNSFNLKENSMFNIFKLFEKNTTNKVLDLEENIFTLERQIIDLKNEIELLNNDNSAAIQKATEAQAETRKLKDKVLSLETINQGLSIKLQEISRIADHSNIHFA